MDVKICLKAKFPPSAVLASISSTISTDFFISFLTENYNFGVCSSKENVIPNATREQMLKLDFCFLMNKQKHELVQ